jgi:hypothetical protein
VIYPVDFRQVGHITDDEMHRILVKPLQPGTRLTAIFDSCHSGTALDLPYIYSTQGILKEPNLAKEAGQGLLGVIASYSQGDIGGMIKKGMGLLKKATNGEEAHNRTLATKTSPADVIMLSGSKDDQTSYVFFFFVISSISFGHISKLSEGGGEDRFHPCPRTQGVQEGDNTAPKHLFPPVLFIFLLSLPYLSSCQAILRLPSHITTSITEPKTEPTQPSRPRQPAPCPGPSSPP